MTIEETKVLVERMKAVMAECSCNFAEDRDLHKQLIGHSPSETDMAQVGVMATMSSGIGIAMSWHFTALSPQEQKDPKAVRKIRDAVVEMVDNLAAGYEKAFLS